MDKNLQRIYESHHKRKRKQDFAIWKKERAKIFSKWIGRGKKVLDLGCRDGTLTKHFVTGNNVTGVDIDKRMLSICKKELKIKTLQLNLYNHWPFPPQSFDVVVMGELLEHMLIPEEVLKKAKKVMKKKGILIGSVPNFYHIKRRILFALGKPVDVFVDPTHTRAIWLNNLKQMLEDDFSKVEIIGLGRKSHEQLMNRFSNLLAHTFVFKATK